MRRAIHQVRLAHVFQISDLTKHRRNPESLTMLESRRNQYCRCKFPADQRNSRSFGLIQREAYARMDLPCGRVVLQRFLAVSGCITPAHRSFATPRVSYAAVAARSEVKTYCLRASSWHSIKGGNAVVPFQQSRRVPHALDRPLCTASHPGHHGMIVPYPKCTVDIFECPAM